MPAVNSAGKHQDRPEGHALRGLGGGDAEQADFGRGVEAEPEQEADRVHVPRLRETTLNTRPEHAGQQAAPRQQGVEILVDDTSRRAGHALNAAQMPRRMNRLARPMTSRNNAETTVPMTPPTSWNVIEPALQRRSRQRRSRSRPAPRSWNGRARRRSRPRRALAFLHQLAHDVVDGGDVVGVEGVPQAERVGEERDARAVPADPRRRSRPRPRPRRWPQSGREGDRYLGLLPREAGRRTDLAASPHPC